MSDTPIRSLTVQTSQAFARQLLDSGRADGPPPEARERALLAFGLAPVGLLAVAPSAAALAPAPGPALVVGGKAVPWVVAKSLAVGLLGSLVALSVVDRTLSSPVPPAVVPPPSASVTSAAESFGLAAAPSALVSEPASPPVMAKGSAPALPQPSAVKPSEAAPALLQAPVSGPSAAAFQDGGLLDLDALARVRRALSAGDAQRALGLLDDFKKRFPASQVAEEAAVLRIEALHAQGRTREARSLGQTFLQERPSSVYVTKVRSITRAP